MKRQIGKTGKDGLKRRIGEFQVEKLAKNIELAVKARRKLEEFSLAEVRDVSSGAATFYVWVSHHSGLCSWGGSLYSRRPTSGSCLTVQY